MSNKAKLTNANTQRLMSDGAAHCAVILVDHAKGIKKKLSMSRQRACEYVIDHAIGKARQKVEHSGGIMTYGELAKSADTIDNKPRRVLADALEIARHHQEETTQEPGADEVASSEE